MDLVKPATFPEEKIIAAIDEWWEDEKNQAAILTEEESSDTQSVLKPLKEIDSHRVVRCIMTLEPVIGIEIPAKTIQSGGYETISELKIDMVSKLKALFEKKELVS
ncbi:hypothetical protein [Brevundimonas sp. P7753]|uniref:hypothetical protein n=1 Tax=Brevundimonas sp. P7753 TaxID=2726982 RepID=UPI0015BFD7DF|nr:hypothetical protein [Brevundimonas sp. P7753]NWE51214.1 hypothetical protein [Brevundimonas sp. P7753]